MSLARVAFVVAVVSSVGCHHPHDDLVPDAGGDLSASVFDLSQPPVNLDAGDLRGRVDDSCPTGSPTQLTGKVFAPNGTLPIYNAYVYVPNSTPTAFTAGVSCDVCTSALSGDPIAYTTTAADGSFTLTGVPGGSDVPVVVQLGHWRRQVVLPVGVPNCQTTAVDTDLTRLPRNKSEGDIPLLAIATGHPDPMECVLYKIGLDAAEFTDPSGTGRVQLYTGTDNPGMSLPGGAPSAVQLYPNLSRYDAVILPCEGATYDKGLVTGVDLGATDPRAQLAAYLDAGGRVFTTHLSYDWLTYTGSPFNAVASPQITKVGSHEGWWPIGGSNENTSDLGTVSIDAGVIQSFPKGQAYAQWLVAAGVHEGKGAIDIEPAFHDVIGVNPDLGTAWITYNYSNVDPPDASAATLHLTFNTPLDAPKNDMGQRQYCGRAVFSDFHTGAGDSYVKPDMAYTFPTGCRAYSLPDMGYGDLSDQEKALAFMLFDLTSCVQPDTAIQ